MCISKERFMQLEPFFTKATLARLSRAVTAATIRPFPPVATRGFHAARLVAAAACSKRTLTRFDTPDCSWVMP